MDGLDCLGADDLGFDYGALLQTTGALVRGGVEAYQSSEAEKAATAESRRKLDTAIKADIEASNAAARAIIAAQAKDPAAKKEQANVAVTEAAQDKAAADLPPELQPQRADAADRMLATWTKNAQAKPKDIYAAAMVKAWTVTSNKAHNVGVSSGDEGKRGDQESWFTRRVAGPLPGYAVLIGGAALVGGIGLIAKKIFFR